MACAAFGLCSQQPHSWTRWQNGCAEGQGSANASGLPAFGEACRYKMRSQEKGIGDSQSRWGVGIWLGVDRRTGQYLIFGKDHGRLRHARTIKPMPSTQQWSVDMLEQVDITPWSVHSKPPPHIEPKEPSTEVPDPGRVPVVRRLYNRQTDLDEHGYTEHCPRCDHIRGMRPGKASNHSEAACRLRLAQEIAKTPAGLARIQTSKERAKHHLAEHLECHGAPIPPPAAQGEDEDRPLLQVRMQMKIGFRCQVRMQMVSSQWTPRQIPPHCRCSPRGAR